MQNKIITLITLTAFTFVTLFSPFPGPAGRVSAQSATSTINTGSLRLVASTAGFSFKKDLMQGDTDPDVKELQKILNNTTDTAISGSGVGSKGQESTYFGASTKAAVIKFQEKYKSEILTPNGLTAGTGLVGKATRTKLNLLLGVTTPTLASVGLPENRSSSGAPASTGENGMSICKFIDILVSINVVTPERANSARSTMKCTTVIPVIAPVPQGSGMSICKFIDLLVSVGIVTSERANKARPMMSCPINDAPSVVVKVNGSKGPISVLPGTEIRLSWHGENVKSCSDGGRTLPVTGSVRLIANTSLSYPVSCIGNNGNSVVDSATVIVSDRANATSSIEILNSKITPGYDFVTFEAETNVSTKMFIVYTNNPTATSSVKVFESATTTSHSHEITGLLPDTTYYAQIAFIAGENDSVVTNEITFKTLTESDTDAELAQRVLSSNGGSGVVSIPDSESLKTDTKVTLEAWVKPTAWSTTIGMSNTADNVIISRGQIGGHISYVLSLDNGKLVYSNRDASIWTNSAVVPLNVWTHVAVTVNEASANVSLYVNGEKISSISEGPRGVFGASNRINKANAITEYDESLAYSNPNSGSTSNNTTSGGWDSNVSVPSAPSPDTIESLLPENNYVPTSNVYIGNFYPAACEATSTEGNGFIGLIDDVKIWKIARTASEIKKDAATTSATSVASTTPSQDSNLVAHYSFDDGRATDLSMYMNNGAVKGDMEIVDDESALSPIAGSPFGLAGLEFNFPESCDSSLFPEKDELAGYKITFKGGVQSVTKSSNDAYTVVLETCDNPTEPLVKSVEVIGDAPSRSAEYYNNTGTISVLIVPAFNMKVPAERDTIMGTATLYISGSAEFMAKYSPSVAASVGYADTWTPQPKSCMKPPDDGGIMGNYAVIGAVVAIVLVAAISVLTAGAGVALLPAIQAGFAAVGSATVGGGALAGVAVTASAGYMAGSYVECEDGSTGCY